MKTKRSFTIIMLLLFFSICEKSTAQFPNWDWARALIGSNNVQGSRSIAVDASGNVYTTGLFDGTTDFDPGTGIFNLVAPLGGTSSYISKLDKAGNFVWAKALVSTFVNANVVSYDIAVDLSGNVYTTGYFTFSADFDPGVGTFNLTANGGDFFISKLDSSGNFVWAKIMGGSGDDGGNSITIDDSGNIYTTGTFQDTADFDPSASGVFNLIATTNYDMFVLKLDSSGNFVWAKQITDASGQAITLDASGNIYTTGQDYGSADLDPGPGTFYLNGFGAFISKLDNSGNFVWAKGMSGSNTIGNSIALDNSNNLYTIGIFYGTVDFDPGSGVVNLTSVGGNDIFISKLDNSGNFQWAKTFGGVNNDTGNSIAIDATGNVYTTGAFMGVVDFDPGAGIFNLTSAGYSDIFISILDSSGNFEGVKAIGGISEDFGISIIVDPAYNVYFTGDFASPYIIFGNDTLTNSSGNFFHSDIFISKLHVNSWKSCGTVSQPADYATGFVTGGYAYVGTGKNSSGNYLTNMYKFDPSGTGTWNTIASYGNAARARATGFELNGNGFIGLGYDGNVYNAFLEYFPATNTWSAFSHSLGSAPNRYYAVSFTIGNTAYVGLGTNGSSLYSDFYSTTNGNTWTPIAGYPGGQRYAAVAFTVGDTAYVGAGTDASGITHQDFYAYDPVNGWHPNPINLGAGNERANAVAFSIGNYGFVALGGHINGTNCTNDLWEYSPASNQWTQKASLPSTSLYNYAFGFSIGGKGYVCMGGSCDGSIPSNETWEYTPDHEVTASEVDINKINNYYRTAAIFPNPVIDHATIILQSNSVDVNPISVIFSVNNLLGQNMYIENKIYKAPDGNITIKIQRGLLPAGFYIYTIRNGNELLRSGKFLAE